MPRRLDLVPLANLVARSDSGAEVPLSTLMPVTVSYQPFDTMQTALERAISPLKLAERGRPTDGGSLVLLAAVDPGEVVPGDR